VGALRRARGTGAGEFEESAGGGLHVNMPSLMSFAEMIRAMGAVRVGLLLTRRDVAVPSPAQSSPDAEVISSMVRVANTRRGTGGHRGPPDRDTRRVAEPGPGAAGRGPICRLVAPIGRTPWRHHRRRGNTCRRRQRQQARYSVAAAPRARIRSASSRLPLRVRSMTKPVSAAVAFQLRGHDHGRTGRKDQ
jgi:hypothetical protein